MQPDEKYIAQRNALIPTAERITNMEVGIKPEKRIMWGRCFSLTMDRLAYQTGVSNVRPCAYWEDVG